MALMQLQLLQGNTDFNQTLVFLLIIYILARNRGPIFFSFEFYQKSELKMTVSLTFKQEWGQKKLMHVFVDMNILNIIWFG